MFSLVWHRPTFEREDYLVQITCIPDEEAAVAIGEAPSPGSCLSGAGIWDQLEWTNQLLFWDYRFSSCLFSVLPLWRTSHPLPTHCLFVFILFLWISASLFILASYLIREHLRKKSGFIILRETQMKHQPTNLPWLNYAVFVLPPDLFLLVKPLNRGGKKAHLLQSKEKD